MSVSQLEEKFRYLKPTTQTELEAYYDFRWQFLRKPWDQPKGSEKDDIEQVAFHRMLCDHNDNVIAVARFHINEMHQAIVRYVAVLPTMQGQGIGRLIMNELEAEIVKIGITDIYLNARDNAIAFYQTLNYTLGDFSHNLFDKIPHYKMHKCCQNKLPETLASLVETWHQTIPVSKYMGVKATYVDDAELIVVADISSNKNLHNTMFAGSVYTLATLTGWGWCHRMMKDYSVEGDIVLADASIRYIHPVHTMGIARLVDENVEGDLAPILRQRKARIMTKVHIYDGDRIAAVFDGKYVVVPKKENAK